MRLARCEKGHYYDRDKFEDCPHCNGMQISPGATVAFGDESTEELGASQPVKEAGPKVVVEDRVPFSTNRPFEVTAAAVPLTTEELTNTTQAKLSTEEVKPMEESTLEQDNEQKLSTEQIEPMGTNEKEAFVETPAFDEMKTIMLEEEESVVEPLKEEVRETAASIPEKKFTAESFSYAGSTENSTEDSNDREETGDDFTSSSQIEEEILAQIASDMKASVTHEPIVDESIVRMVEEYNKEPETEASLETSYEEPEVSTSSETSYEEPEGENFTEPSDVETTVTSPVEENSASLKDSVENVAAAVLEAEKEELNSNPVIGWLVCIEGIHKGNSYDVKEGRNFIGRSMAMDICLAGNSRISREKHAIITYDPRSKSCFFQPDETRDLIYINDKLILGPEILKAEDIVFMGDEKFLFYQLKSDKVDWI